MMAPLYVDRTLHREMNAVLGKEMPFGEWHPCGADNVRGKGRRI